MSGPVIAVKFRAGQAEFFEDLTKIKVGVRQFGSEMEGAGHAGVSGFQATSATLRVMEGGLTNNLRAAERFASSVLGLGPLLQAAFPLIGGLAFVGLLDVMGEKVVKFYTELRDGPEKSRAAFDNLNSSLRLSNDELDLSNAKLENEIAKLEGKHESSLKEMLADARIEADKLGESLDGALSKLDKVLEENKSALSSQLFGRISDKGLREEIEGQSGFGGFTGEIRDINREGRANIDKAGQDPKAVDAAIQELKQRLVEKYKAMLAAIDKQIANIGYTTFMYEGQEQRIPNRGAAGDPNSKSNEEFRAELLSVRDAISLQSESIPEHVANFELTKTADADRAAKAQYDQAASFNSKMEELQKQIDESNARIAETMLRGSIREHEPGDADVKQFRDVTAKNVFGGMWNGEALAKQELANRALDDQIKLQQKLLEVAGNFHATHQAELDAEVSKMKETGSYREKQISDYIKLDQLKQETASRERLASINLSIAASGRIAGAAFGSQDAVRQAELENKIAEARAKGASEADITKMRLADQAEYTAQIISDAGKLATADSNRMETLNRERAVLQAAHDINKSDLQTTTALRDVDDQRAKLASQMALDQGTALSGVKAFFLEMQEQSELTSKIMLDGLNSAVDQTSENLSKLMTGQGKKSQWADEFKSIGTKMLGSAIKSELETALGSLGKKMGIHPPGVFKPTGAANNPFYVNVLNGCSGGEASSPGAMSTLPPMGSPAATGPGSPGWGNGGLLGTGQVPKYSGFGQTLVNAIGGLFGGGGGGGGNGTDVSSSISYGGGMAAGGPVEPGSAYLISDSKDDEYFLPKSRGSIVPAGKGGGDGGTTIINNIDARNADLGAANRLHRVLEARSKQATVDAIQAQHERSKRVPSR